MTTKLQRQLIDWTIDSLETEPEVWVVDEYYAKHPSGVAIWICNGPGWLRISVEGIRCVGGQAFFTGWLTPWRRKVLRLSLKLRSKQSLIIAEKAIAGLLQ